MGKKSVSPESYGPYFDTYIKFDREGVEHEQEIPAYREVSTSHGTFGVPKGHKLTFKTNEKGVEPVYTPVKTAKIRKPKKVEVDKPATDTEE